MLFRYLVLVNTEGNYAAKSGPIISLFLLIFRFVSSRRTILFHSICSFRYLLYLHVRVLFAKPNPIIFKVLFVYFYISPYFLYYSIYFYRSASISINHHNYVLFAHILFLYYNFGSSVLSLLINFSSLPPPLLSSFILTSLILLMHP